MTQLRLVHPAAAEFRPRIGAVFADGAGCPVVVCGFWEGGCVVEGPHPNTASHLTWVQFHRLYKPASRPVSDYDFPPPVELREARP